jgi:hypothetical protein
MENIIVKAHITNTSNKVSEEFKGEVIAKTAYLRTDEENAKLLEDFGLTKYTSKNGDDFFALKFTKETPTYNSLDRKPTGKLETTTESPNFKIDEEVQINVIKGEKLGHNFYRLQAVLLSDTAMVELIEAENPFL